MAEEKMPDLVFLYVKKAFSFYQSFMQQIFV